MVKIIISGREKRKKETKENKKSIERVKINEHHVELHLTVHNMQYAINSARFNIVSGR